MIDRESPLPLAYQVARTIREQIVAGRYQPGDQLTREETLAVSLGVSRGTVRQALDALAADGLVSREQGRGTFVRRAPGVRDGFTFRADLRELMHRSTLGREPDATARLEPVTEMPTAIAKRIGGERGGGSVVTRVLTERSVPYGYVIDYVPSPFHLSVTVDALARGGVLQAIEAGGTRVAFVRQTMNAAEAPPVISAHLRVAAAAAVLVVDRTSLDQHERVLAVSIAHYVGDLYRDTMEFRDLRTGE